MRDRIIMKAGTIMLNAIVNKGITIKIQKSGWMHPNGRQVKGHHAQRCESTL